MVKGIDLQMVAFVGASLLQDYLSFISLPRIYYFSEDGQDETDDRVA